MEERKPLDTVGGNVNLSTGIIPMGNNVAFPQKIKKLKREYDPAISLLCREPKEMKTKSSSQKDVCTPMFNAALFKTAKLQKPPKCPIHR